jgi:hypothetical protein
VFVLFAGSSPVTLGWAREHFWDLLVGLFFVGYGILGVLRPGVVLRWVAAARPGSALDEDDPALRRWVRGLAWLLGAMGILVLWVAVLRLQD